MPQEVVKFRLWAEILIGQRTEKLPVIRFASRFALNDVPKATLVVALGRRIDTDQPSPIHRLNKEMSLKRLVRVFLEAEDAGFAAALGFGRLPAGKTMIFEGYTLGSGFDRSFNSVGYTLELEHWLADLTYASSISAISSPLNPSAMIFPALTSSPVESEEGKTREGGFTGISRAERFVTRKTLTNDFWGQALHPFLLSLTKEETFPDTVAAKTLGLRFTDVPDGNAAARSALLRFEPGLFEKYRVPLSFDPAAYGGDMARVAEQIVLALGAETFEALAGSTIWDKLIQYTATYMMAVVPMIDRALVVPFAPALKTPYLTITADEYESARLSRDMPRVLRGVGVFGGRDFENGGNMTEDGPDYDQFAVGGYYQGATAGQILFVRSPMWIASANLSLGADRVTGADGRARADALDPGAGAAPDGPKPKALAEANIRLMNKYAEALYVAEVLKYRSGEIAGRLRFDIAPGTIVRVELLGEKFLGAGDELGEIQFGTVVSVDTVLDAEAPRAGTVLRLAHLRSGAENGTAGFALERHPIWTVPWYGAPLLG